MMTWEDPAICETCGLIRVLQTHILSKCRKYKEALQVGICKMLNLTSVSALSLKTI